jgi:hypothetical protein
MRNAIRAGRQGLIILGTAGVIAASFTPVGIIHLTDHPSSTMNAWGEHCKGARWSFSPWFSTNA